MFSRLLSIMGAFLLGSLPMSDYGNVFNNDGIPKPSRKYSLDSLFDFRGKQEELTSCNLNQIFNPPVSDKPVDVRNLKLSNLFEYDP